MRIELWLLLICVLVVANIYTEGKYLKNWMRWRKYYQIAGVILGTGFLYFLIRKNPMKTGELLQASNDYLKYMPMDKNSANLLSPILDFTAKQSLYSGNSMGGYAVSKMPQGGGGGGVGGSGILPSQEMSSGTSRRMLDSGKKSTKRSVSETKKKFVASRQNWRCGNCNKQLTAWFEVDHKIRLEYGGSNHIDNLVALCRECHGEKTTMENL